MAEECRFGLENFRRPSSLVASPCKVTTFACDEFVDLLMSMAGHSFFDPQPVEGASVFILKQVGNSSSCVPFIRHSLHERSSTTGLTAIRRRL